MEVISQVENGAIEVNGVFYWDILYIFKELQKGLKKAFEVCGKIDSIGICTWGVDFGLIGKKGELLGNPLSYRNVFGEQQLNLLTDEQKEFMFYNTGIQNNRINSVYQLLGIKENFTESYDAANKMLMIPDMLLYMFTGKYVTESTIASTTQLLDVEKMDYSKDVIEELSLNKNLFTPIIAHGEKIGDLKESIAKKLHINVCPFICVPSHDTASAVVAVPAHEEGFIFISSGTWSLIGSELQKPIINEKVFKNNFANEVGAFNTITLLKNSTGMHILQKVKKEMEQEGHKLSWDEIENLARTYKDSIELFDPNDIQFFNPTNMIKEISKYIGCSHESKQLIYQKVVTSVYRSLAYSYRYAIEQIEEIIEVEKDKLYIIGGGSRNYYLNQLTADLTGKTIISGCEEATSLGNMAVQLKYYIPNLNLANMRKIIENSENVKTFFPDSSINKEEIEERYKKYKTLISY